MAPLLGIYKVFETKDQSYEIIQLRKYLLLGNASWTLIRPHIMVGKNLKRKLCLKYHHYRYISAENCFPTSLTSCYNSLMFMRSLPSKSYNSSRCLLDNGTFSLAGVLIHFSLVKHRSRDFNSSSL